MKYLPLLLASVLPLRLAPEIHTQRSETVTSRAPETTTPEFAFRRAWTEPLGWN